MIGSRIRRLFGLKAKQNESEKLIEKKANEFRGFVTKARDFFSSTIEMVKAEYFLIISKFNNLLETNYQLGLKHLEAGNLSDAIFRFRFIKKFWPEFYEGQYRLAYCLKLKGKNFEAQQVLVELLEKNRGNKDAEILLNKIKKEEIEKGYKQSNEDHISQQ